MTGFNKLGVLIPCYNEQGHIGEVIKGVLKYLKEVIVVDDGSSDSSFKIISETEAEIIRHEKNKGKGAALESGFRYILRNKDWDGIIVMDADGQHDWNEMHRFFEVAPSRDIGIVIGNRMQDVSNMPWLRMMTNRITSRIISRIAGQYIPDSQCGYRLIKARLLRDINLKTSRFDAESEILVKAAIRGYRIISVPISTIYNDEKSYVNPVVDTVRFIKLVRSLKKQVKEYKKI